MAVPVTCIKFTYLYATGNYYAWLLATIIASGIQYRYVNLIQATGTGHNRMATFPEFLRCHSVGVSQSTESTRPTSVQLRI